jgi:hypothetical protein
MTTVPRVPGTVPGTFLSSVCAAPFRGPAQSHSDPLATFPAFASAVRHRLEAGSETYGNRSFNSDSVELVGELEQEALDLAGWGYILFCRLEAMREALWAATQHESEPQPGTRSHSSAPWELGRPSAFEAAAHAPEPAGAAGVQEPQEADLGTPSAHGGG